MGRGDLDGPLTVACAIYEMTEVKGGAAHFTAVVERLEERDFSTAAISRYLTALQDYGIVEGTYELLPNGKATRCYTVTSDNTEAIRQVYETYWAKN